MGSKERRERQKLETRQRILDAARELFATHGYANVTMRKIAEAIEYSPTAIYLHFADKEALMRELSLCDFESFSARFRDVPAELGPVERICAFGRVYVQFAQSHPNQYRLLFMSPHPPDAGQLPEAVRDTGAYEQLLAVVQAAQLGGAVHPAWRDPHLIAQLLWTSLHGVVSLHQVIDARDQVPLLPVETLCEQIMALHLAAFRAPPPR